jgi:hypothetical protein
MGLALFAMPEAIAPAWPWALTPLTARAVAAGLLGLAAVALAAAREDDPTRIRVVLAAYTAVGLLPIVILLRDPASLSGGPSLAVYLLFYASVAAVGAYGLWRWSGAATSRP